MSRAPVTLSLVERGWQGAREFSLAEAAAGRGCWHVVKGRLEGTQHLIRPYPGVRILPVPRQWFLPAAIGYALRLAVAGRLGLVLVDNEKAQARWAGWARRLGCRLARVTLKPGGGYAVT